MLVYGYGMCVAAAVPAVVAGCCCSFFVGRFECFVDVDVYFLPIGCERAERKRKSVCASL